MEIDVEALSEKFFDAIFTHGPSLIMAILIFVVGKWIAKKIANLIAKGMDAKKVDQALTGFIKNLVYSALLAFVCLAALSKIGIQTASFIAVLGAAGLAIGMALQGSLSNFAAGVMIILFKPFKIGDFVDIAGQKGTVKDIQIFVTTLSTPDNIKVIVPNSHAMGGVIVNFNGNDTRRVDMVFGIGYDDDVQKAKEILSKLCSEDERILKDPAPTIEVSELADSSVNFACRPWAKSGDYWGIYFSLNEKVKAAFDSAGISIPYPQQDVHVKGNVPTQV